MKKLLAIVFLSFLWCETSNAENKQVCEWIVNEVYADLLKEDWGIEPGVWNVTSFSELRRNAEETARWNLINPGKESRKSHLENSLANHQVPTIAASDYVKMVSEQIGPYVPGPYYALGTDGFGRSDTRKELRKFFEVDKEHITTYGLSILAKEQLIASKYAKEAIKKYKIDIDKPMPTKL